MICLSGGKRPSGYTIVEVMIVLAVSGTMFLIAATFINGKQQATAFNQGANEMASRVQDVLEQVIDGQYSDVPFICTPSTSLGLQYTAGTAGSDPNNPSSTSTDKANSACTFAGKFLHLNYAGHPDQYEIFTLAAATVQPGTSPPQLVTTLSQALVGPVNNRAYNGASPVVDLTQAGEVAQALNVDNIVITPVVGSVVTAVYVADPPTHPSTTAAGYGFGFMPSFGSLTDDTSTSYASGAQAINLVFAPLTPGASEAAAVSQIQATSANPQIMQAAQKVVICLSDGKRYAQVTATAQTVTAHLQGETQC